MMSCMLKAAVPRPTDTKKRVARARWLNWRQVCLKSGRGACSSRRWPSRRGSCFHNATMLSSIVTAAAPCTTWISRVGEKLVSNAPNSKLLPTMPNSNITYISATTRGRDSGVARSVANASPAVCVVCMPAPTSKKASTAPS